MLDNVLARMAPEVAATFTPTQREALQVALTPRRHQVDLRLSMPLGLTRMYVVLLAGTETRSPQRRRLEAAQRSVWTPLNVLVMGGVVGTGIVLLLAVLQLTATDLSRLFNPGAAPAGIPFKADRGSCEQSGRTWQDDTCLDFSHDPTF